MSLADFWNNITCPNIRGELLNEFKTINRELVEDLTECGQDGHELITNGVLEIFIKNNENYQPSSENRKAARQIINDATDELFQVIESQKQTGEALIEGLKNLDQALFDLLEIAVDLTVDRKMELSVTCCNQLQVMLSPRTLSPVSFVDLVTDNATIERSGIHSYHLLGVDSLSILISDSPIKTTPPQMTTIKKDRTERVRLSKRFLEDSNLFQKQAYQLIKDRLAYISHLEIAHIDVRSRICSAKETACQLKKEFTNQSNSDQKRKEADDTWIESTIHTVFNYHRHRWFDDHELYIKPAHHFLKRT
ncbi:MAG: hypothetical protein HQ517_04875 [SAR324 cluster bacterium]|nr:hypothetical protein [SAR324 cluster bacterium]